MPSSSLGVFLTTYTFPLTKFWPCFKDNSTYPTFFIPRVSPAPSRSLSSTDSLPYLGLQADIWNDWYPGSSIYAPGMFLISRLQVNFLSQFQGFFLFTSLICNTFYETGRGPHDWICWLVLRQICVIYLINLCPPRTTANKSVVPSFPAFLTSVFGCWTEPCTRGMFQVAITTQLRSNSIDCC